MKRPNASFPVWHMDSRNREAKAPDKEINHKFLY